MVLLLLGRMDIVEHFNTMSSIQEPLLQCDTSSVTCLIFGANEMVIPLRKWKTELQLHCNAKDAQ